MTRSITFACACYFLAVCVASAQDPVAKSYGDKISAVELREYLSILASDAMEGRETGKRGQKMAAAFIRAHFEDLQLTKPVANDYLQPLEVYKLTPGETYVKTSKATYVNFKDIAYYGTDNSNGEVSLPLTFIGNGSEADLSQLDVNGKAVLLLAQSPWLAGNKEVALAREKGARMVFVCNTQTQDEFDKLGHQIKLMTNKGGLSLTKPDVSEFRRPGLYVVSPLIVEDLIGVSLQKLKAAADDPKKKSVKKIKPGSIKYKSSTEVKTINTENVLGLVEGTDKKNEIVAVTAHYDHVGVKPFGTGDLIHNGADDDGSGTVAVMEMAKVFAQARKEGHGPRRSMLFMLVTGEESGLLGSEFYTEHPIYPLANTVVDLNIDMIGRRDMKHQEGAPYLYVIGADKLSSTLNTISESTNNTYTKLDFDYTYNDEAHPERLYYRSDHWNFAKRNIPVIFYFDGIHEDYHRVTDEVEKIDFDLLAKRTQCVFYTAWEVANREERIRPDKN